MQLCTKCCEFLNVRACRADQRHAGRQAVAAKMARHSERAKVQKIDEIRVGAQFGIRADQVRRKIAQATRPRKCRHHRTTSMSRQTNSTRDEFRQLVNCRERIRGAEFRRALDNGARRRMKRRRRCLDEIPDALITLRDPRALIQQRRDVKNADIFIDLIDADLFRSASAASTPPTRCRIAPPKWRLAASGTPTKMRRHARRIKIDGPRIGIRRSNPIVTCSAV